MKQYKILLATDHILREESVSNESGSKQDLISLIVEYFLKLINA